MARKKRVRNPDEGYRLAGRGGDLAAALAARLRAGDVSQERVAYAAALGYGPALELVEPVRASASRWRLIIAGVGLLGRVEVVRWAADVAEDALRFWGGGSEPALAIAAARAWADCPCEYHGSAAGSAAAAAITAQDVARSEAEVEAAGSAAAAAQAAAYWAGESWLAADALLAAEGAAAAAAWAAWFAAATGAAPGPSTEAVDRYSGALAERLCWGPPAQQSNPDRRARQAERGDDPVEALAWRVRTGEVAREHLELAARLGEPRSLELAPDVQPLDWQEYEQRRAATWTHAPPLAREHFPIDAAERVLPYLPTDRGQYSATLSFPRLPGVRHGDLRGVGEFILQYARRRAHGLPLGSDLNDLVHAARFFFLENVQGELFVYNAMDAIDSAAGFSTRDSAEWRAYMAAGCNAYAQVGRAPLAPGMTDRDRARAAAEAEFAARDREIAWQKARLASYALGEVTPAPAVPWPPAQRANPDEGYRLAGRGDDPAAALAARLRAGEVTQERVEGAAALGYEPAVEVVGPRELRGKHPSVVRSLLALAGKVNSVLWACQVAEDALAKHFQGRSRRPAECLTAARAWAACPCRKHASAAGRAGNAWWSTAGANSAFFAGKAAVSAAKAASLSKGWEGWAAEASTSAVWSVRSAHGEDDSAKIADMHLHWLAVALCWGPPAQRANPDRRAREAGRGEDPVAALAWRLRAGEVEPGYVQLAAALGDERALALYPEVTPGRPGLHTLVSWGPLDREGHKRFRCAVAAARSALQAVRDAGRIVEQDEWASGLIDLSESSLAEALLLADEPRGMEWAADVHVRLNQAQLQGPPYSGLPGIEERSLNAGARLASGVAGFALWLISSVGVYTHGGRSTFRRGEFDYDLSLSGVLDRAARFVSWRMGDLGHDWPERQRRELIACVLDEAV